MVQQEVRSPLYSPHQMTAPSHPKPKPIRKIKPNEQLYVMDEPIEDVDEETIERELGRATGPTILSPVAQRYDVNTKIRVANEDLRKYQPPKIDDRPRKIRFNEKLETFHSSQADPRKDVGFDLESDMDPEDDRAGAEERGPGPGYRAQGRTAAPDAAVLQGEEELRPAAVSVLQEELRRSPAVLGEQLRTAVSSVQQELASEVEEEVRRGVGEVAVRRRACCSAWPQDRLPVYTGLRSQYGLSQQQLQERNRLKEEIVRRRRERRAERAERRQERQEENERMFRAWLTRKRAEGGGEAAKKTTKHQVLLNKDQLETNSLQDKIRPATLKEKQIYSIYLGLNLK